MKKEIQNQRRGGTKVAFLKCSREAPEEARNLVSYAKISSTLLKRKRKIQPKAPKTPEDFVEGLTSENARDFYGKNYLGFYRVNGKVSGVAFGEQLLVYYFILAKYILMDATYRVVPLGLFYQVLIIHFIFRGHTFPALVILMESKSREHYDAAFKLTKDLFPQFSPTHGMADHEIACRASAQHFFDGLLVKACWFHYW